MSHRARALACPIPFVAALIPVWAACSAPSVAPAVAAAPAGAPVARPGPPPTRADSVVETLHGVAVADPYRWLEGDGPDVKAWVEAQNRHTRAFLDGATARAAIRRRLEQVWNYPKVSAPVERGGRIFWRRNDGLANQAALCWAARADGACTVLFDPNALAKDGTVALSTWAPDRAGKLLAYATSSGGSDWTEIKVRQVDDGADRADHLRWVKFSGIAWNREGTGFWYSRFDPPKDGEKLTGANENQKVCFHRLGDPQDSDAVVWRDDAHPKWGFTAEVSDDARFLVIDVHPGAGAENGILVQALDGSVAGGKVFELVGGFGARFDFVGGDDGRLYFRTDLGAPRGRLVSVRLSDLAPPAAPARRAKAVAAPSPLQVADPSPAHVASEATAAALPPPWRVDVGEDGAATLQGALVAKGGVVLSYLRDAHSELRVADPLAKGTVPLAAPPHGTIAGLSGHAGSPVVYFSHVGFLAPPAVAAIDLGKGGAATAWFTPPAGLPPGDYTVAQVKARSKDGTQVPVFVVNKANLVKDGTAPTYLYGYGGFGVDITPTYQPAWRAWLEMGGVVAVAVLRGGGEYGDAWHEAGRLGRKQNVFDDFIAAAEWLVAERVTSPRRLAIAGGSNGGLLVGACLNQRPDLFGAALPAVGVMDMLRYHKFTIGWAWVSEYGSADDPKAFEWLRRISPVHNVRSDVAYPPVLVTTGDHDDRVVPAHSYKYTAALQHARPTDTVLIRVETRAGHGAGKPTGKLIEEWADRLAFLARVLGVQAPPAWAALK